MLLLLSNLFGNINWLSAERLLTIAKIAAIISLMGATSYITWNLAQRDMDKERVHTIQQQLDTERATTTLWLSRVDEATKIASKAAEADRKLDIQVNAILKEHKNAPPLPADCVLDTSGLLSLQAARAAAIATANPSATSKPNN